MMFINNQYFASGYAAAHAGMSESSCELLFDAGPRKFWILGYDLGTIEVKENFYNAEPMERVEKSAEQQGRDSFDKGIDLDDCPFGPDTQNYLDWRAGWLAQSIS